MSDTSHDPHDGKSAWDIAVESNERTPSELAPATGSASLDRYVPELHNVRDAEEWCEIRVRKDWIPKGARLVEAYLTEREVIICGSPKEDDESHNCDAMGCTTLSHVLYRLPLPNDRTDAQPTP